MSTEPESLRDQLRDAEERVSRLRDENERLEQKIMRPLLRIRIAICILAAVLAGAAGFMLASRVGKQRAAREMGLAAGAHAEKVARERADTTSCEGSVHKSNDDLASCQKELMRPPTPPPWRNMAPSVPCRCQAGDPLCSCL